MRKTTKKSLLVLIAAGVAALACVGGVACSKQGHTEEFPRETVDLSGKNAAELEALANYQVFYKPEDATRVGDMMPYYENGVYSIFYLKDGGGTDTHPIYRVDTTDFVHYEDKGLVLSAGAANGDEAMLGTGSVVKNGEDYYFFYTGHPTSGAEKVLVAKSEGSLDQFEKQTGFSISPLDYGFENDFRDPEVIVDTQNSRYVLIVATRSSGKAVLAKFSVPFDFSAVTYEGILYEDTHGYNMLECPDLFEIDGTYYITYSAQDLSLSGSTEDTENAYLTLTGNKGAMYYLMSDSLFGEYTEPYDPMLDSMVFYAGKYADGKTGMLIGWAREKATNLGFSYEWGGNLTAHRVTQNGDKTLSLTYPESYVDYFSVREELTIENDELYLISSSGALNVIAGERQEYRLSMNVRFDTETEDFGLAFAVGTSFTDLSKVTFVPFANKVRAQYGDNTETAARYLNLQADTDYRLDIFAEGSNYVLYINGVSFTFKVKNSGNKSIALFANGGMVEFTDISYYSPSEYEWQDYSENGEGTLTLVAGESKEFTFTAKEGCYQLADVFAYSDKTVRVEILDTKGRVLAQTEKSGLIKLCAEAACEKGEAVKVRINALENATVEAQINVKRNYRTSGFSVLTSDYLESEGKTLVADAALGAVGFDYAVRFAEDTAAVVSLTRNDMLIMQTIAKEGEARLRGAVELSEGDELKMVVEFGAEVCKYELSAYLYTGGAIESNLGYGDFTEKENSADFGVDIETDRKNAASLAADFGEQGKNGFVYVYGRAIDEMKALSTYNTNSEETYNYKHIDKEVCSDLEVKGDWGKTGGGYFAGVAWVAAADGEIGVTFTFKPTEAEGGFVLMQLYHNRFRLKEDMLTAASDWRTYEAKTAVKAGDVIVFAFRNAASLSNDGVAAANYSLEIRDASKGEFDFSEDTLIGDYAADFYTQLPATNAWSYGYSQNYNFDTNNFEFNAFDTYNADTGAWESSTVTDIEIKSGWFRSENNTCDAAIGYTFDTTKKVIVHMRFSGSNADETRMAARILVVGADGNTKTAEFISNGQSACDWQYAKRGVSVDAGDTLYVIFFREGVGYHHGTFGLTLYE